jgi:FeS assembly SUF system regulator
MLRISKLADYATGVMGLAARRPDEVHSAAKVALSLGIGQATASKVLKLLAQGGLVTAQRGVKGGYVLARAPERISLAEIIDAIEGIPLGLTECSSTPGLCVQESGCLVRDNWQRISVTIRRALEGVTLADMALPALPAAQLAPVTFFKTVRGHRAPAAATGEGR